MTQRDDHTAALTDDELEQRLREVAARADAVPDLVLEQARAAFTLRRLDEELAELVLDSLVDDGRYAVRGAGDDGEPRMLAFRSDRTSVEVEATPFGSRWSLRGLVAGASGAVEAETAEGTASTPLDGRGRFAIDDLPSGQVRLHLTAEDGSRVTTSWVRL